MSPETNEAALSTTRTLPSETSKVLLDFVSAGASPAPGVPFRMARTHAPSVACPSRVKRTITRS